MKKYKKMIIAPVLIILLYLGVQLTAHADVNAAMFAADSTCSGLSTAFMPDGTINNIYFGIVADDNSLAVSRQNVIGFTNAIKKAGSIGLSDIKVEPNHYYVDTSHGYYGNVINTQGSIALVSGIHLSLAGAVFEQIVNGEQGYAIFTVKECEDVSITGGTLIGDKEYHDYSDVNSTWGNSHEWGFGISLQGSTNVRIVSLNISNMTGDGIHIGGSRRLSAGGKVSQNIEIDDCTIDGCRRQSISIVGADTVDISNCQFSNNSGFNCLISAEQSANWPGYNIDLESSMDWTVSNIDIHHNQFGSSESDDRDVILVHQRTSNIRITDNEIEGNITFSFGQNVLIANNVVNGIIGFYKTADPDQVVIEGNSGQMEIWY